MNGDIELVIKISEEMYENIQSRDWKNGGRWFSEEWKAIHNGIPLPKGHGRLKDVDHYIKMQWEHPDYSLTDDEPTIIEADEGGL